MFADGTTAAMSPIMRRTAVVIGMLLVSSSCASSSEVIPLLSAAGIPLTDPTTVPLRVVTRSTAVNDPLRMGGSSVEYADIEAGLGHAVSSAMVPWADAHRTSNDGWQHSVEITNADLAYAGERVIFALAVRATLRNRAGNIYLAQTQASCRQGGVAPPDKAAPIIYRCMLEVGRDLAGWIAGVDLEAVATSHP